MNPILAPPISTRYAARMCELPPSDPSSFELGDGPRRALCLHGFTGTPYEVLPLGQALASAGFAVRGPLLAGHGHSARELAQTRAEEIVASARRAWPETPVPIALCGFSMGALVAGILAAERPDRVAALVLLAPAARLFRVGQMGVELARRGLWRQFPYLPKIVRGGDIGLAEGRRRNPSLASHPLRALLALDVLMQRFAQALPQIQAPVFVAHGRRDRAVPWSASEQVRQALRGEVEIHYFERSRHVLLLDVERAEVCRRVVDFCERAMPER